mgnify:CR=1 FL=1
MEIERRRGLPGGRAVLGGVLMAIAAVGVFTAYSGAGEGPGERVVVARSALRVGQTIGADDLALAEVDLGRSEVPVFGDVEDVVGRVALGPVDEGGLVQPASVSADARLPRLHEVAITVPRSHVAVGRLKAGERVDVFVTHEDLTRTVARGAQVVELGSDDGSTLTSSRDVTVVVAVPGGREVAAIVHALRTGEVTLVRSAPGTEPSAPPVQHDGQAESASAG